LNVTYFEHFLKYLFQNGYWKGLCKQSVNQASVNQQDINKVEINFPQSLPEQQRIVAILDEAFAAIAKAKANAEQNLKNAKELFESYLQGVFENGNWEKVKLSELAKDITDGDHMPPPKSEEGFPFITISNINKQNRQIDFSDTFKVPKAYFDKLKENRKPKKGDVLYTVTGSYGIPVLIESDIKFCFQRHIGLIRPKENVSSKWLYYWILSPQALFQANDTATGTAQKTVSLKALRNFVLPKMDLKAQQAIVQKLDALSTETKKLESIYQQKINDLEELKKSVLQKAFNGELKTKKAQTI
jgi:type I restriction enzyme S subunit